LAVQGRSKLGLKFYGPFWMGECVGMVAYKLELLVGARVHNVFHVRAGGVLSFWFAVQA
jgi:hypothetical protein